MVLRDPLRPVRSAIQTGDFRAAWNTLQALPGGAQTSAEWQLLAAMAVWRLGDFLRSRAEADRARAAYRDAGDVDGEMRSENVAAAGAFALGDLRSAEHGFLRARRLADRVGNGLLGARCANNLGNVHYYRGDHVSALNAYSLAAAEFESERFDKGLAEAWHNMGIVLRDVGQFARAREATDRAIELARFIADQRMVAQAMSSQAETLVCTGEVALSRVVADRALALASRLEDQLTCIDATRVLSIVAAESGDLEAGLRLALDACDMANAVAHPWMIATGHSQLGEVHRRAGNRAEAGKAFRRSANEYEGIGAVGMARHIRGLAQSLSEENGTS